VCDYLHGGGIDVADYAPMFLRSLFQSAVLTWLLIGLAASRASAQAVPAPAAPTGPWIGSVGGGVALTSGNTDTSTINISYDVTYDPKTKNVVKSDLLFLKGKKDGELIVDRLGFNLRDQYNLGPRAFTFGQLQYLRDTFKAIDYLVAPTAGLGYKVVNTPQTSFNVDGGVGGVWEKNPGTEVHTSAAVTASEHLTHKLSDTANLVEQLSGLWKTSDTSDALYTFGIGLIASLTAKSQLKVELLDTYKGKPPTAATKKNDVALIFSITYKLS
jgi:putative salt-induced outer membrane protein